MTSRRASFLPFALVLSGLAACSDNTMTAFPEEDASDQDGAPSFDIPSTDAGGTDARVDLGTSTDTSRPDRGTPETGICPSSCSAGDECNPCRTSDTPDTVAYCCISGLCVSMTGTCPAMSDGGSPDGMGDAPEGGRDAAGGRDGADPNDGAGDDSGTPVIPDAGPASDLGRGDATAGDGAAGDGAASDGAAGDGAASDGAVSMDASDGRG